jgi:hypothetical protein
VLQGQLQAVLVGVEQEVQQHRIPELLELLVKEMREAPISTVLNMALVVVEVLLPQVVRELLQ